MSAEESQPAPRRAWARWLAFEPIRHARWEVLLLRLGLA